MDGIRRERGRIGDAVREESNDDRRYDGKRRQGQDAAREVLQHLAFRAMVVLRMRRAAGNRRSVERMRAVGVRVVGFGKMLVQVVDDEGQRAERRPRERDQRAPGDARAPPAREKRVASAAGSNRHPGLAAFVVDAAKDTPPVLTTGKFGCEWILLHHVSRLLESRSQSFR